MAGGRNSIGTFPVERAKVQVKRQILIVRLNLTRTF